ncbi:hypothetical protein [Lysinibacillus sp. G4S2]|uniref:hypothetical protein n=1 Tax=Lysinibacillus sp. G4S2 TaxID=3055859 RepID=UPI0025A292B1|nr:hypothetical protein [Lysinibacillus sp. G4S2]MDM5249024.1 hypothetical protein [Lysinibacillus sp. G4S2]
MFESYRKRVLATQEEQLNNVEQSNTEFATKKKILELEIKELNRELKEKELLLQEITIMMIQDSK